MMPLTHLDLLKHTPIKYQRLTAQEREVADLHKKMRRTAWETTCSTIMRAMRRLLGSGGAPAKAVRGQAR